MKSAAEKEKEKKNDCLNYSFVQRAGPNWVNKRFPMFFSLSFFFFGKLEITL